MQISRQTKAELCLVSVALSWGLTYPFIRIALGELSSLNLLLWRGVLATAVFIPFILMIKNNQRQLKDYFPYGALMGVLFFFSYFAQSIGLETTTSGRSAFLTNMTIVFVPVLSPFFKKGLPTKIDITSAFLAMCGLFFLTDPLKTHGLKSGDFWTLGCAFFYAIQIHVLQIAMKKRQNAMLYTFWQMALVTLCCLISFPFSTESPHLFPLSPTTLWCVVYLGVLGMGISLWMQNKFQHFTTPERASIIYITEPLCATVFGYLILNESFSRTNIIGAGLIIVAMLWHPCVQLLNRTNLKKNFS